MIDTTLVCTVYIYYYLFFIPSIVADCKVTVVYFNPFS